MELLATVLVVMCSLHAVLSIKTTAGVDCKFPFEFKGTKYNTCIDMKGVPGVKWCGVADKVADNMALNQWGICKDEGGGGGGLPDKCKNPKTFSGKPCYIPFEYNGVTYESCSTNNSPDKAWCSFIPVFPYGQNNDQYDYCNIDPDCPINVVKKEGDCSKTVTEAGQKCAFPFRYDGVTYNECSTAKSEFPWCALDTDYVPGRWGYCKLTKTKTGTPCSLPFRYGEENFARCTTKYDGQAWCAFDPVYQQTKWDYCALC